MWSILKPESTCKSSLIPSSYRKTDVRRQIPSASAALVIGSVLGIIQALFLIFAAKPILNYMGVESVSFTSARVNRFLCLLFSKACVLVILYMESFLCQSVK